MNDKRRIKSSIVSRYMAVVIEANPPRGGDAKPPV